MELKAIRRFNNIRRLRRLTQIKYLKLKELIKFESKILLNLGFFSPQSTQRAPQLNPLRGLLCSIQRGRQRKIYILLLCRENTATQKRSALPEYTYFYKFFIIVFFTFCCISNYTPTMFSAMMSILTKFSSAMKSRPRIGETDS